MSALPRIATAKATSARGHVCFTPESGHVQCTSPCLLWANSGHHCTVSAAYTAGVPGAGGTTLGAKSERGTFNLQTSPCEAKVTSAFPPNCSSADKISRVPKPRRFGTVTGGPPLSRHSRFSQGSELDQPTDTLPPGRDKAPYFAALVASS